MVALTLALLVALPQASAQEPLPINLYLQALIDHPPEGQTHIHLLVKGDVEGIKAQAEALGGHYKYTFRNYASLLMPLDQVETLAAFEGIERIEVAAGQGQALNGQQRINNNVEAVHNGLAPLPKAYRGSGILMGIIDSGLELDHGDFRTSNNKTRVIELWDQRMGFNAQRTPSYGYGQIWDSADINAGICPHDDYGSFGHGTNVAGIATGNGLDPGNGQSNDDFKGIAPEADIVIVATNFGALNWTVTVAEAIDYIFHVADSLDMPCVINASIGTYLGSHDGKDVAAQMIDSILAAKSGRVLVCAAGNSGSQDPYHLGYDVTSDTNWTWFQDNSQAFFGTDTILFEIWADTQDFNNVHFAIGLDNVSSGYVYQGETGWDDISNRLGLVVTENIMNNGTPMGTVSTWAEEIDGRYFMQFFIQGTGSIYNRYRFMTTGSGRFDCWSGGWLGFPTIVSANLPLPVELPDIVDYKAPDLDQSIVSSWACSPNVITVGNYINRTSYEDVDGNTRTYPSLIAGNIADDSSFGPTRLGVLKPDMASPGGVTLSATESAQLATLLSIPSLRENVASDGVHNVNGGTSMASPAVAGVAALFLEKCPKANHLDVKAAITSSAKVDVFTGTTPNTRWGHGKTDGFAALLTSNFSDNLQAATTEICVGEVVNISLPSNYSSYFWSTGDTTSTINVDVSGLYHVQLTDSRGCVGQSDTLFFIAHANPDKPVITASGPLTFCEGESVDLTVPDLFGAYTWSTGAHTNGITVSESGTYTLEVMNIHGCSNVSDPVSVSVLPAPEEPALSFQDGKIIASLNSNLFYQWYRDGELLPGDTAYFVEPTLSGDYTVVVTNSFGCSTETSPFAYVAVGLEEAWTKNDLKVFPNPTSGLLNVAVEGSLAGTTFNLALTDPLGRIIWNKNQVPLQSNPTVIDLGHVESGVYFLEFRQGNTRSVFRVVMK